MSDLSSLKNVTFILENLPGHVYWLDRDNVYVGCNMAQAKAFGLASPADVVGKKNRDFLQFFISAEDADKIDKINESVMATGQEYIVEETVKRPDNVLEYYISHKKPLFNAQHQLIGLLGISTNIIDIKNREEVKRRQQEQFQALFNNIISKLPAHLYWKDTNGIYLGCNDAQAKSLGLTQAKEVIGKTDFELPWAQGDAEQFRANDLYVMSSHQSITTEEPAIVNGKPAIVLSQKFSLEDANGKVFGILGVSLDITERKRMEQHLADAGKQAKEAFLRNMRHDLRTPFSGILTLSEWMATQETEKDKKENLDCIAQSARVLLDYMNTILDYARENIDEKTLIKKPINLEKLITQVMEIIKPIIRSKNLQLTLNYPAGVPKIIESDAFSLQRILLNLLGNAVKFTHEGEITIALSLVEHQADNAIIAIAVGDTGIGIPADKREAIFEKFTRLEAAYEGKYSGMGLGLYDVKEVCRQLDGEISVTQNGNQGSIFTCIFPFQLVESHINSSENTLEKKSHSSTNGMKLHILLVEDQAIPIQAATTVLTSEGHLLDVACNGYQALERFTEKKYDVVLLDIGLPDFDGITLAKKIRQLEMANHQPPTTLIALTAHESIDENDMIFIDEVLTKPFSIVEFKQSLIALRSVPLS
jgi:PAS domain S-box-containing protein